MKVDESKREMLISQLTAMFFPLYAKLYEQANASADVASMGVLPDTSMICPPPSYDELMATEPGRQIFWRAMVSPMVVMSQECTKIILERNPNASNDEVAQELSKMLTMDIEASVDGYLDTVFGSRIIGPSQER